MNLELFQQLYQYMSSQTASKKADTAKMFNFNDSACVKLKIYLKELERNVPKENYDAKYYIKMVKALERVLQEITVLGRVLDSCFLLESHSASKRRNIQAKYVKRKTKRIALRNYLDKHMKGIANDFERKALVVEDVKNTFEIREKEFMEIQSKYLKDAAALVMKREMVETMKKELEKPFDAVINRNKKESQELLGAVTLQAKEIDESIATREKDHKGVYETYERFMTAKFLIDEADFNLNTLESGLEECFTQFNAESEIISGLEYREQSLLMSIETKEEGNQAELNKLNDLCEYLAKSVKSAKEEDKQATKDTKKLKMSIHETETKHKTIQQEFGFWKTQQADDDDSESDLEELFEEIRELQNQIQKFNKKCK